MQGQHCTTAEASAVAKTQTLIAGTLRCSRGARQLFAMASLLVVLLVMTTAFLMIQMILDKNAKFTDFATTVDQIEAETGIKFFTTMQRGEERKTENVIATQCLNQGSANPAKDDRTDRRSQRLHSPEGFDDAVSIPVSVIRLQDSRSIATNPQRFGRDQLDSDTELSPDDYLPLCQ